MVKSQERQMLALQIKQIQNKLSIPAIYDQEGLLVYEPKSINKAFQLYYSALYKSEHQAQNGDIKTFLKNISLPTLSTVRRTC